VFAQTTRGEAAFITKSNAAVFARAVLWCESDADAGNPPLMNQVRLIFAPAGAISA